MTPTLVLVFIESPINTWLINDLIVNDLVNMLTNIAFALLLVNDLMC